MFKPLTILLSGSIDYSPTVVYMRIDRREKKLIILLNMGSCFPWGLVSLILFLLLQSMLHLSFGYFVEERAALLDIQSSLIRARSLVTLDSWGEDGDDCCSWEHVKCNNSTHRVSHLNLSYVYVTTDADGDPYFEGTDSDPFFQRTDGDPWYFNIAVLSAFH